MGGAEIGVVWVAAGGLVGGWVAVRVEGPIAVPGSFVMGLPAPLWWFRRVPVGLGWCR